MIPRSFENHPMTGTPAPKTFFVKDPFTEEVQGPMDVKALRQWFEQGGVEDWGVSNRAMVPGLKPKT